MIGWWSSTRFRRNVSLLLCLSLLVFATETTSASTFRNSALFVRGGTEGQRKMQSNSNKIVDDSALEIGGGAINEKHRRLDVAGSDRQRVDSEPSSSHFDPCHFRSHLWHAFEGLDRYPNYLSRWSTEDIDRLEDSLEAQLQKVRQQRQSICERRDGIDRLVNFMIERDKPKRWQSLLVPPQSWNEVRDILDPRAGKAILNSKQFQRKASREPPAFQDVLAGRVNVELDPALLEDLMDQEMFDVYSLPLLSEQVWLICYFGIVSDVIALTLYVYSSVLQQAEGLCP